MRPVKLDLANPYASVHLVIIVLTSCQDSAIAVNSGEHSRGAVIRGSPSKTTSVPHSNLYRTEVNRSADTSTENKHHYTSKSGE